MAVDKSIESTLHGIIHTALGAPGGDPDSVHMMVAAIAYLALQHYGLDTSPLDVPGSPEEPSTRDYLAGENVYGRNFLEDVTWDGEYTDKYRNK